MLIRDNMESPIIPVQCGPILMYWPFTNMGKPIPTKYCDSYVLYTYFTLTWEIPHMGNEKSHIRDINNRLETYIHAPFQLRLSPWCFDAYMTCSDAFGRFLDAFRRFLDVFLNALFGHFLDTLGRLLTLFGRFLDTFCPTWDAFWTLFGCFLTLLGAFWTLFGRF